eukprot:COSAG02_NODE_389_length_23251_cov_259.067640_8_plen_134_part_00
MGMVYLHQVYARRDFSWQLCASIDSIWGYPCGGGEGAVIIRGRAVRPSKLLRRRSLFSLPAAVAHLPGEVEARVGDERHHPHAALLPRNVRRGEHGLLTTLHALHRASASVSPQCDCIRQAAHFRSSIPNSRS